MSNLWQQRRKCSQPIQVAHTKLDHSSNFRPFSNYTNILSVMMSLYWISLYQLFINAKNLPLKKAMIRVFYSSSLSSSLSSPFSLFMLVFILENLKNKISWINTWPFFSYRGIWGRLLALPPNIRLDYFIKTFLFPLVN